MKEQLGLSAEYDDGPSINPPRFKEQAFRRGFLESAQHIVRVWAHPPN